MMRMRCYISSDGKDAVREWYHRQDHAIRADFAGIIEHLQQSRRARYNRHIFKELDRHNSSKNCVGLHEIRGVKDGCHYRIIGYLHGDIFTMLVPFLKTSGYIYARHCNDAATRKAEIDHDRRRSRVCEIPSSEED
jgi:hypothetical protein